MTVALDPQTKAMLDLLNAAGPLFLRAETPEQAREKMRMLIEARPAPVVEMYDVENRHIPGPHGEIPIRIYTPQARAPMPVLVYFHGGGWVLGGLDSHDFTCRSIASVSGCLTIAVDYRLAPEHKFPAAPEDCYAAIKWTASNAKSLGGAADRMAVGGDSAGGNLATVVALMARDRGGPALRFQLLIYPAISAADDTPSQREFAADGFILSRGDMEWFWGHYLASPDDARNPLACPNLTTTLAGLPPALVITASHDPLRDEGEAYAEQMRRCSVKVSSKRYDGVTHGFVSFSDVLDKGKEALGDIGRALRAALGS